MKKIFLLCFLISSLSFGADHLMYAPSGNLVLDAKVGSVVKVNKTLRVDNITNLAGTSGAPGMVPVGGLVAVMPNTHANAWQPPAMGAIKDGFMRADGAVVPTCADCVIPTGTATPNMVTRFLKGSTTSGTTDGSPTKNLPAHYHGMGTGATLSVSIDHDHPSTGLSSGSAATDGAHTHPISFSPSQPISAAGAGTWQNSGGGAGQLVSATATSSGSHSHSVSGSTDLPNFTGSKTPTGIIGLVTGGCDGNSGSSCSINVEPAYMETVWIIRVK